MYLFKKLYEQDVAITVSGILFIIAAIALAGSHLDAKPSQSIMTAMVWLLPVIYLFRIKYNFSSGEKLQLVLGCLLFFSALLSFFSYPEGVDLKPFRTFWLYLLPLGLVPVLANLKVTKEWLLTILIISGIFSFAVILKDLNSGGVRGWRHGLPIPYGVISLTTGLLSLIFFFDRSLNRYWRIALISTFLLAFSGTIWSQTRGGWLYFALWASFVASVWLWREASITKKLVALVVVILVATVLLQLRPGEIVQDRIKRAALEVEMYIDGKAAMSSTGQRFDLWRVAGQVFIESPITGSGLQGFISKRDEMLANHTIALFENLKHAHNDLRWMASTRGIVGVLVLMFVYIGLLRFYWRKFSYDETRIYGAAGLTVVCGAMVYGLTDIFMSLKITIGYFFILNAILIRLSEQELQSR